MSREMALVTLEIVSPPSRSDGVFCIYARRVVHGFPVDGHIILTTYKHI